MLPGSVSVHWVRPGVATGGTPVEAIQFAQPDWKSAWTAAPQTPLALSVRAAASAAKSSHVQSAVG